MIDLTNFKLTRSNRSTISISILRNGELSVKAPYLVPKRFIEQFVKSKSAWIEKRQRIINTNKKQSKKFENGEKFQFLGKDYALKVGLYPDIEIKDNNLLFPHALAFQGKIVMEKWYIRQAKKMIKSLVDEYAGKMDASYNAITFSDTRSQWGRCTSDNRLQFNWRLIMTPYLVIRYVVIHELAHTYEKNHSAKFWSRVRSANPSYKMQIKWLKENGHGLIV